MKKRVFAILLCLMLCMTALPITAFAGEGLTAVTGGSPCTGDNSNIALWIVIAVVALAAIIGITVYLLKRKK